MLTVGFFSLPSFNGSLISFLVVAKFLHGYAAAWRGMAKICQMMNSSALLQKWMFLRVSLRNPMGVVSECDLSSLPHRHWHTQTVLGSLLLRQTHSCVFKYFLLHLDVIINAVLIVVFEILQANL